MLLALRDTSHVLDILIEQIRDGIETATTKRFAGLPKTMHEFGRVARVILFSLHRNLDLSLASR